MLIHLDLWGTRRAAKTKNRISSFLFLFFVFYAACCSPPGVLSYSSNGLHGLYTGGGRLVGVIG
jgi:hypothetical protein